MNDFRIWPKGARRRPARVNVGKIEGIELGPEDVALGAEGGVGFVLLFARGGVFHDPGEREFGVFRSLCEAAGEIVETTR